MPVKPTEILDKNARYIQRINLVIFTQENLF